MKKILDLIKRNKVFFVLLTITIIYIITRNGTGNIEGENFAPGEEIATFTPNTKPVINANYDNSFFLTTLVDTKYIDSNGEEKWTYSLMMQDPRTSFSGEYLAVWNNNTNSNIDVFNKKGFVYEVENTNKILDVDVNKKGYISVLSQDITGSGYILNVYNDKGENIVNRISDDEGVYPISTTISEDNRMVALCEIDTNSLQPKSNVTFSYINPDDNKNSDLIFTGVTYSEEIVANIKFVNNYVLAYTSDNIHIISVANDIAKETATIPLKNEVEFCEVIDDKYIAVAYGVPKNAESVAPNTVVFYNFNGNEISSTSFEGDITRMTPSENSVIIINNREISKVSVNGKIEYTYVHNKDIYDAYCIGNKNPAILVENDKIVPLNKSGAVSKGN